MRRALIITAMLGITAAVAALLSIESTPKPYPPLPYTAAAARQPDVQPESIAPASDSDTSAQLNSPGPQDAVIAQLRR